MRGGVTLRGGVSHLKSSVAVALIVRALSLISTAAALLVLIGVGVVGCRRTAAAAVLRSTPATLTLKRYPQHTCARDLLSHNSFMAKAILQ